MMSFISIKDIDLTLDIVCFIYDFCFGDLLNLDQTINSSWLHSIGPSLVKHLIVRYFCWVNFLWPTEHCPVLFIYIKIRQNSRIRGKVNIICQIWSKKLISQRKLSFIRRIHINLISRPQSCINNFIVSFGNIDKFKFLRAICFATITIRFSNDLVSFALASHRFINCLYSQIGKTHFEEKSAITMNDMNGRAMLIPNDKVC